MRWFLKEHMYSIFEGCAEHVVGFWDTSLLCSAKKKHEHTSLKSSILKEAYALVFEKIHSLVLRSC